MKSLRNIIHTFSLTRGEQIGSVVLLILIGSIMCINLFTGDDKKEKPLESSATFEQLVQERDSIHLANQKEFFAFNPNKIDSAAFAKFDLPERIKRNILNYRAKGGRFRSKEDVAKIYGMNDSIFAAIEDYIIIVSETPKPKTPTSTLQKTSFFTFNPNSISAEALDSLALPEPMKRNLIKYRKAGGTFRQKEDFKKLYGMTSELYAAVEPFLEIPIYNSMPVAKVEVEPISIELNSCTAEELQQLKGIGKVFSERIIKYREQLGGFASAEQLRQVYGMPEETVANNLEYLHCDGSAIEKLPINFATEYELRRHPLISNEQAKQIVKLRAKKGSFSGIEQLNGSIFTEYECKLLEYYLKY